MLVATTLSLVLLATPTLPSDPAELLPGDCLIYMGTDSIKAGAEAGKNTAMSKILDEAEVRAFLHRPTAAAEAVLKQLMEQAASDLGDVPGLPPGGVTAMNLELDLDPSASAGMNLGQAFVALTHLSMPEGLANPLPDIGLAVGIQIFDSSQIEMLKGMWSGFPGTEATGNYNGVDYSAKMLPETTFSVTLVCLGDLVVVSLSEKSLHGIIDRFQGKAPKGSSLVDSAEYEAMLSAAGGATNGGVTTFVRVAPLMGIAQQFAMMAIAADGGDPEQMQLVSTVFADLGLTAIRMIGSTSAVGKDGLIHNTSVTSIDSSASGLIPGLVKSMGSIDLKSLDQVPGDAIGANLWTMGDELVSVYDFVMNTYGVLEGPEDRAALENMITEMLGGASLRDDLLGNLHGNSMYYSVPGQGFTGAPESVVKTGVRNGAGLVKLVEALAQMATEEAGMPVELKSTEHEGVELYELDLSQTPVGALLKPSFAIRDGELFLSDQVSRLKSVLNGGQNEGDSLAKNAGLSDFLASLGDDVQLQGLAFSNNAESFSTQYGQIAQFLPMVGAMAGNIPVDFAKLPNEKAITQYLGQSYAAQYTDANGFTVGHTITQFQTTDFFPILLVGGLVAFGEMQGMDVAAKEVEVVDPRKQAQLHLRELKAGCTVYKISTGGYPENLAALLAPLPDYEDGALPRSELPVDPWGNAYYFALEVPAGKTKAKPKLWSAGPDGINDNGEGDDVLKF